MCPRRPAEPHGVPRHPAEPHGVALSEMLGRPQRAARARAGHPSRDGGVGLSGLARHLRRKMIADANHRGLSPLGGLGLLGRVVRARHRFRPGDGSLGSLLRVQTDPMASPGGFVLRAELLHDLLHRVDSTAEMRAADRPGSYLLDEPELALSFSSCLRLLAVLVDLVAAGSQVVVGPPTPPPSPPSPVPRCSRSVPPHRPNPGPPRRPTQPPAAQTQPPRRPRSTEVHRGRLSARVATAACGSPRGRVSGAVSPPLPRGATAPGVLAGRAAAGTPPGHSRAPRAGPAAVARRTDAAPPA